VRDALEEEALDAWTRGMRANHDIALRGSDWSAPMMVYADALQSAGDIRGDLIALDLSDTPRARALRPLDREALHRRWLGALASHPNVSTRFGLVSLTIYANSDALLRTLVQGPAARYIEAVRLSGTRRFLAGWMEELAQRPLPWLGRLSLTATDAPTTTFAISRALAEALAAPRLHTLSLDGDFLLADLAYPLLTSLEVDGFAALGSWHDGAVLRNVVALDLALAATDQPTTAITQRISSAKFPRLRTLDLSRNAPVMRTKQLLPVFETSPIVSELHHVKLPPVLDSLDARVVQQALDRMPMLQSLAVTDWYGAPPQLLHPTATLALPPAKPWTPRTDVDPSTQLRIESGSEAHLLGLLELCHVMENRFSRLDAEARAAWSQIWASLRSSDERIAIPRAIWNRAMTPCAADFCDEAWRRFLERSVDGAEVVLHVIRRAESQSR
jgi:hypothetical protein